MGIAMPAGVAVRTEARLRDGTEKETESGTLVSTRHRPPAIPIAPQHVQGRGRKWRSDLRAVSAAAAGRHAAAPRNLESPRRLLNSERPHAPEIGRASCRE